MVHKPASIIYGVDDRPPPTVLFALSVQHIFLMSSTLVLPVVLISEVGGGFDEVRSVVALTMMACGIGTILQAVRWGPVGGGYLCPNLCGPNFFSALVSAAWLGGIPLMRGMTLVAGLVEALLAGVLHRVRRLFPAEVTGLVVLMVAFSIIPLGASKFLGINFVGEPINARNAMVATLTLLIMVGVNVWGSSKLKLYSVLFGMLAGYSLSMLTGLVSNYQFQEVGQAPWIALPLLDRMTDLSFEWSLLPTFVIVSICGALKTMGNLIMCQMVNDREWTAPDMKQLGRGLMADSICVAASGLLGGMASDTSASNVGLSRASGATSRYIGFCAGGLFFTLGFSPKLAAVLSIMPMPVMGSILIFVTCFMIMSGLQVIVTAKPDERRVFIVGVSLVFGLSLYTLPQLYATVSPWVRPMFDSPLTLTTILAVVLNQLLRLGERRNAEPGAPPAGDQGIHD